MANSRKTIPARTIKASEFKATCLELMDEVAARRIEIVVTKRGKPVAKLAPVQAQPPNPIGFLRGTVIGRADVVSPDFAAWRPSPSDPLK
jgi:prevent-host-death family protein